MNSLRTRKTGEGDPPRSWSAHVATRFPMTVAVFLDVGEPDFGHRSSHELPPTLSCRGRSSKKESSSRTSHTLRPSIRRGPGIRPSVTSWSNLLGDTQRWTAAAIRERPRRGRFCASRFIFALCPFPAQGRPSRAQPPSDAYGKTAQFAPTSPYRCRHAPLSGEWILEAQVRYVRRTKLPQMPSWWPLRSSASLFRAPARPLPLRDPLAG